MSGHQGSEKGKWNEKAPLVGDCGAQEIHGHAFRENFEGAIRNLALGLDKLRRQIFMRTGAS